MQKLHIVNFTEKLYYILHECDIMCYFVLPSLILGLESISKSKTVNSTPEFYLPEHTQNQCTYIHTCAIDKKYL